VGTACTGATFCGPILTDPAGKARRTVALFPFVPVKNF